MPCVVSIIISKHLEDVEKDIAFQTHGFADIQGDAPQHVPEELVDAHGMVQVGGGSGFIVSQDGLILTNKHVVGEPRATYCVMLADGTKYEAHILTRDPVNDIAIIKIAAGKLPVLPLADSSHLKLGASVLAFGNALGIFKNTVSQGIISGLSRSVSASDMSKSMRQELRGLIQTDAAINPGNSGGPLVDSSGKAIGINVAVVSGAHSIGLAIPVNAARRDLEDLKQFGRIRRPYIGVRYVSIDQNMSEKLKLPVMKGALIMHEGPRSPGVIPGSPASKADLRELDIILSINGQEITPEIALQDILENVAVGETITISYLRKDEMREAEIIVTERK